VGNEADCRELGCSRNTVKRWLSCGSWQPCAGRSRLKQLGGLSDWLAGRFRRHSGNADVIRQELAAERGVFVSCGQWNGRWHRCGASLWPKRGRGCGLRRDLGTSFRSILVSEP
jgi:hypothetical protein